MARIMVKIVPMLLIALYWNAYAQSMPRPANDCLQQCKADNKSCIGSSDKKLDECIASDEEITCMLAHNKRIEKCKIADKACTKKCSQPAK